MHQPHSLSRLTGFLFLAAFLLYGTGSLLATDSTGPALWTGATLMLLNSLAVLGIGVLMHRLVRTHAARSAQLYLGARAIEAIALAIGVVGLLTGTAALNFSAYNMGMLILGLGSIPLFAALGRLRLLPRWLAGWGVIGYAVFATGSLLELIGVTDAGLYGAIPGGLFEVTLGVWLIVRSLRLPGQPVASARPTREQVSA